MLINRYITSIIMSLMLIASTSSYAFAINDVAVPPNDSQTTSINTDSSAFDVVSEKLDYVIEKNQFIASGNAIVTIKANGTKLKADVITFDQNSQTILAQGHVRIIKDGTVIKGDFTKIDLTKESALIGKPVTSLDIINIVATEANIYSNDIIEVLKGTATIDKKVSMLLSSYQMGSKQNLIQEGNSDSNDGKKKSNYRIVTKNIIIKGSKEKNIIRIKNAQLYRGKTKVANIPSLELTADKELTQIETSLPEIGNNQQIGTFFGPGYVFHVPGGATFKAAPLITGGTGGIGYGGLGRITTSTNRTEFAYGTTKKLFVLDGEQELFRENTKLVYGQNAYISDGILGRRRPDYIAEIVDEHSYYIEDLDLNFSSRLSAGYAQDYNRGWGTGRFKAQGDFITKAPLFALKKTDKNDEQYNWLEFRLRSQYDVTIYGNGDRFALIRMGPSMSFREGPAWLNLTYFQSGVHGQSPFLFDRYYYGKSNLMVYTNYKLTKKVELGYIGYLNLTKDNWNKKLLAENQIYARLGSDDLKFKVGYDTVREATIFGVDLMIGSDRTDLDFEKMKIINPNQLSKPKKSTQKQKTINL